MNNADSLRKKLIEAMKGRFGDALAESVFQHDLWPVLDAAMKAGELLVHRATEPQRPVADALTHWLTVSLGIIEAMIKEEHTISKARVFKTLRQFHEGGSKALGEARMVNQSFQTPYERIRSELPQAGKVKS